MEDQDNKLPIIVEKSHVFIGAIFIISICVIISAFIFAIYDINNAIKLGPFGDFLGGAVNPLLSFFCIDGRVVDDNHSESRINSYKR